MRYHRCWEQTRIRNLFIPPVTLSVTRHLHGIQFDRFSVNNVKKAGRLGVVDQLPLLEDESATGGYMNNTEWNI